MNTIKLCKSKMSTTNNGVFQGWGTSLCWWANRIGYSPVLTEKASELFFGESGLRMNIMRYNIGGGDDPTHKHIKRTDSMIPGWLSYDKTSNKYTYDYNADKNQLNVLRACYDKSGDKAYVEVFSNSPPYFMCKSGCSSGGKNPKAIRFQRIGTAAIGEGHAKLPPRISLLGADDDPGTGCLHIQGYSVARVFHSILLSVRKIV